MKIDIITMHNIHNFGSVFQAYALQQYLLGLGHRARIIDYEPDYYKRRGIQPAIGRALNYSAYQRKKGKFANFITSYMNLSEHCETFGDLERLPKDADIYVTGGDQLWNPFYPCGNDPAFKLQFVRNKKKIAFGTSIAQRGVSEAYATTLTQQIADYSFIGVRESSSVPLLNKLGKDAYHVVDPVLLLPHEHYDTVLSKPKGRGYLFVYLVYEPSKLLDDTIEFISRTLSLKVIACTGFRKKCKADLYIVDEGPEEVLGYVKKADFVISASFHCTLFSLLYNKQFLSLLPNESTNERLTDLLFWTGLSNRIIRDESDVSEMLLAPIDYESAHDKIDRFIAQSKLLLNEVLEE